MVYGFNVQFNMIFVTASPQKPSTTLSYLFGRQTVSELDRDRGPSVCCWRAAAAGPGLTWTSFSLLALAVPWLAAPLVLVHPAQMSLRLAQRILQSSDDAISIASCGSTALFPAESDNIRSHAAREHDSRLDDECPQYACWEKEAADICWLHMYLC